MKTQLRLVMGLRAQAFDELEGKPVAVEKNKYFPISQHSTATTAIQTSIYRSLISMFRNTYCFYCCLAQDF
jgi:hypothetical protein